MLLSVVWNELWEVCTECEDSCRCLLGYDAV